MTIEFENLKLHSYKFCVADHLITLRGPDAKSYIHSQVTSNIKSLENNSFQLSSLLDNSGKIISSFLISCENEETFHISINKKDLQTTLERIEKFHISEDFEITTKACYTELSINSETDGLKGSYFSQNDKINFTQTKLSNDDELFKKYKVLTGTPEFGIEASAGELINNTYYDELSVDYKKGCYPGQETVAKIDTRRGAAFKPVLLIINGAQKFTRHKIIKEGKKIGEIRNSFCENDKTYCYALINRENRIDKARFEFTLDESEESFEGSIHYYPYLKLDKKSIALEIYDNALEFFHAGNNEMAVEKLKKVIELDPSYEDAYESLGVIFGRMEKFETAIELMEQLKELNPKCMMAYTNLSLYHMKLGNIETAEKFKADATLLNFQLLGDESKAKKEQEKLLEKKKQEAQRRESMFKQVLEMDSEDAMANNGMGEIEFERENFKKAIEHFDQAIKSDKKYSVAYLGLAKSYYQLNEIEKAKTTLKEGISIASKNGDLMPANEMQSILTTLD